MSATKKSPAVDADMSYFYARPDLTIDPPLKDAIIRGFNSDWLKLKQKKDEDVKMVDGEIQVVTTNITTVTCIIKPQDYGSGYDGLKADFGKLVALVAANGSTISGYILIRRHEDALENEFFRLVPDGSGCKVEAAVLTFPDGTRLPMPSGVGLV